MTLTPPTLPLVLLRETLAVCRLPAGAHVPAWAAMPSAFVTVSRTRDELSIITAQRHVPTEQQCERDYRVFKVKGPLPLDLIGIFAAIATPLADAGLSIFPIATYDTDYVLVKAGDLGVALEALRRAGHTIDIETE